LKLNTYYSYSVLSLETLTNLNMSSTMNMEIENNDLKIENNVLNALNTDLIIESNDLDALDEEMQRRFEVEAESEEKICATIYRFKFTEEFMADLYKFAKIHQYDHRKDFKEAWEVWTEENSDIVQLEFDRLINLGYEGDILDKMFKSARYYFRKKSTVKAEPKTRRQYISVNHNLLDAMDIHIKSSVRLEGYQPKNGFTSFCKENEIVLKETITNIFNQGIKDSELIQLKLKKTYKNRYFMLISK